VEGPGREPAPSADTERTRNLKWAVAFPGL
jgi:hypothetical protein